MSVNFVNISTELKQNASFCLWKKEKRGGRVTKVPYNPSNGTMAKTNDFVLSDGEFFELKPGRNLVQCTGLYLNRVWITPNWWTV